MNISRQCAHKWWRRFREEGEPGLRDRSSRPHGCPHRTPERIERRIVALRQSRKLGPARLAGIVDVPASTVHRVLVRNGMNRLRFMDRPTGRVVRRIETDHPGELVHVDVKKLARIPSGGGHKKLGPALGKKSKRPGRTGYTYIHSAIDAHSRIAYSEILGPETALSTTQFLRRAVGYFGSLGIMVERVLSDNGAGYKSHLWADTCAELGIHHTRTKPYRPQTNGKIERFNRTLADEWAYVRLFKSEAARARTLDAFLHRYNHHRHHTAIGSTPMARVTNLVGQHT